MFRTMKSRHLIVWAVIMLVAGATGLVVALYTFGGQGVFGAYSSVGQQIYYTGADAAGPIPRSIAGGGMMGLGMMGSLACIDCHGQDGRGGRVDMRVGSIDVPDIRYSTLSAAHSEGTQTIPAWSDGGIARAIRDGVEPDGQQLKAPMPRWSMTDEQIRDVIAYLKELSPR